MFRVEWEHRLMSAARENTIARDRLGPIPHRRSCRVTLASWRLGARRSLILEDVRRSRIVGAVCLLAISLSIAGCSGTRVAGADDSLDPQRSPSLDERDAAARRERAARQADDAADELLRQLMGRLQKAMNEGGPSAALHVCSDVAQDVTTSLGDEQQISIRRTGLRVRNPTNRPDDFETTWLQEAAAAVAAGDTAAPLYQVMRAPAGGYELRHLRPIIFPGGMCSQCHGGEDEIQPQVRALLRELYPADQATDFKPGDLRGAVSVRVPLR